MGNESSVEMAGEGSVELQTQGEEHLWSLRLQRGPEGEGEGACVFVREPGKGAQAELCRAAVEHLRLLRHPNIVKFLGCQLSPDSILLVTEPLVPVARTLKGITIDSTVMGWRCVGVGLDFLHQKACLSHNNLSTCSVYVNTIDSQWKLGGFEAASLHSAVTAKFLSSISSVRHSEAIPPEDKAELGARVLSSIPTHARDVWGFGNFILSVLEEAGLEAQFSDSSYQYINDELLNPDPHLRPAISEVLTQPWMSNQSSLITDFLSKLTLKSKGEKDAFFRDLAGKLHSLSPSVVAEHIVPLLVNPLVMAEPVARESLWKHLLLPASSENPRVKVFDSASPCPLLKADLFKSHVIPLVLNHLESRDCHVRLTLLDHLRGFVSLCDYDDLVNVVLPEVLVGLKDSSDDLVRATLHALGDLVPILGADLVTGASQKQVFADAKPRTKSLNLQITESINRGSKTPPTKHKDTHPMSKPERSREDRMREMKERREQQRLKRIAQSKLGHVTPLPGVAVGDSDTCVETVAPPTNPSPQYSPSISHDEVECEGLGGSGTSVEGKANGNESSDTDEKISVEWEGFHERDRDNDWGETWSNVEEPREHGKQVSAQDMVVEDKQALSRYSSTASGSSGSKLLLKKSSKNSLDEPGKEEGLGKSGDSLKARLNSEDIQRLEEQSVQAVTELDLFADMTPNITISGSFHSSSLSSGISNEGDAIKTTPSRIPNALHYQQEQEEVTSGDWGSEDWGKDF